MTDDTAPAWASALLETMNTRFDQVDARLDALVVQLEKIGDRLDQVADKIEEAGAAADRSTAMLANMQARFGRAE